MDYPYLGKTRGRKYLKKMSSEPSGNSISASNNFTIISSSVYVRGNYEKDFFSIELFIHRNIVLRGDLNVSRNFQPKLLTSAFAHNEGELIVFL
jgi:hypothetical protein